MPGHERASPTGVDREGSSTEHSPLLAPSPGDVIEDMSFAIGGPVEASAGAASLRERRASGAEATKSTWYLILLALSIGGLQLAWAVELSNGSPLLLSLGISKSTLAVVWLAGPISGVLMQPYIGMMSDRHRSRFGRRRPFMVGGAIATISSLFALAWNGEIIGAIFSTFHLHSTTTTEDAARIIFAVLMVYILDFSINAIQAAIRAFIVDNAPTHQQDAANAWASRLTGVGNIFLYLIGYADLPKYLWFFGNTQFKILCVIASLGMIITLAISCATIAEKDSRSTQLTNVKTGYFSIFKDIFLAIRHLPPQIRNVCIVQLAAWIGWFPFLFYTTTYVGQIYVNQKFKDVSFVTPDELTAAWEQGTRYGSFALMVYAIVFLCTSIALPWFIQSPARHAAAVIPAEPPPYESPSTLNPASKSGSTSTLVTSLQGYKTRIFSAHSRLPSLAIPGLTLRRAWQISHILFAALSILTFAVHTTTGATVLVAFFGIPWSLTMWAPFALIAAEVSRQEKSSLLTRRPSLSSSTATTASATPSSRTGVILGIHNVAIAAPQIVASLLSSAIFRALQKGQGDTVGDNSVAWVLRLGGVAALVAAGLTSRVRDEVVD